MESNEVEQEKELNDQLSEIENLFSNLIIWLNEKEEIEINDEKDIEPKINLDDNNEKEKEVINNIKEIKEDYPKNINGRYHYTISDKLEAIEFLENGNSIHKTVEKFGEDRKAIKWWKEYKNDYNIITNPSI